ncbi:MAG: hypothetical protein JJU35_04875 [Balneolales bacterium]|nr:hypothetical protein [Balneolales bacterium]
MTDYNVSYLDRYTRLEKDLKVKMNYKPLPAGKVHPFEQVYLSNIFEQLVLWDDFYTYNWYVISASKPYAYTFGGQDIVIYLSNENHLIPAEICEAKAVFTPYLPDNAPENCFAIPLGYNGSLIEQAIVSIEDRPVDVFFSGNVHRRRLVFAAGVKFYELWTRLFLRNKVKTNFKLVRRFTGDLSPDEYSKSLMDAKIALVPEGHQSNNTYRFFEACKYGNIVLTAPLYNYWFYADFPGLKSVNWLTLPFRVGKLLRDPVKLNALHLATLNYYEAFCKEEKVAQYMRERIVNEG